LVKFNISPDDGVDAITKSGINIMPNAGIKNDSSLFTLQILSVWIKKRANILFALFIMLVLLKNYI